MHLLKSISTIGHLRPVYSDFIDFVGEKFNLELFQDTIRGKDLSEVDPIDCLPQFQELIYRLILKSEYISHLFHLDALNTIQQIDLLQLKF